MEIKTKNLYKKLMVIQNKVNGLGKDKATNTYKYVTGSKVLSEIKPTMNELGLILKQEIISIENVRQDYTVKSGNSKNEILSKVMMQFTWIDTETGEKDVNSFGANGQNDWDKGVGSALTYAERYFLLKYFHIATDEDDIDNDERKAKNDETATVKSLINEATDLSELIVVWNSLTVYQKNLPTVNDFKENKKKELQSNEKSN